LSRTKSILCCFTLAGALLQPSVGLTKGGTFSLGQSHKADHLTSLPPEIRQAVISRCKVPHATNEFAGYRNGVAEIVLHYEHPLCGLAHAYCARSVCLEEVYGRSTSGRYRLIRSSHVVQPEIDRK